VGSQREGGGIFGGPEKRTGWSLGDRRRTARAGTLRSRRGVRAYATSGNISTAGAGNIDLSYHGVGSRCRTRVIGGHHGHSVTLNAEAGLLR